MAVSSRIAGLHVGVNQIDRLRVEDDVHLPRESSAARTIFLPQVQALDAILARHTLDERLALDVVPDRISAELMTPVGLSTTREDLAARFEAATHPKVRAAGALLRQEAGLDEEVRMALAELMQG
ncbi:hypothetical protein [Phaeobacter sp. HF9A]|uniref:type III secretion apparatus assembly protein SctX n=1 Tax=Phaeobacter sp. HF9A TaxID=2721561 RepID=UPI001431AB15|nr:hypothetical protein [Phaeobacter sp. HF9A]NIZ12030.1 hypothetical protein [Phaeobacter sp. HF9A]